MSEEQEKNLRHLHKILQIKAFRELPEEGQIGILGEVKALLFDQSVPMSDRRRLGNLICPIAFASGLSEQVKAEATSISSRWDHAPF